MPGPKLFFDQNLSPRLVRALADLYPGSGHARDFELHSADDEAVWQHAAANDYTIVTKDDDFRQKSFLRGSPPKVIWVHLGNCRTADVEAILRARHEDVLKFETDAQAALLVLTRSS